MIVTELKQKGKSESYYAYFDNELYGELQLETLVKHHIKVGEEISNSQLEIIKEENDKLTCFNRALKYISSRLKTEKQMREYLHGLKYSNNAINQAINKLKEYGYINDEHFAKTFVEIYGESKGKKYLQRELMLKGVSQNIITSLLEEQDETVACEMQCAKKIKNMAKPISQKDKEKLYRFLLSKGFEFSVVKQCVSKFISGEDDCGWD
ncbi:MAG: RecX family transcriptional regulator [Clostridia bacterium]|nr:RecX family transcriptional regulator [Clostridia bacterium]